LPRASDADYLVATPAFTAHAATIGTLRPHITLEAAVAYRFISSEAETEEYWIEEWGQGIA
jgi:hypothetical protein